jgi:RNA polymerase sigma-70 factor (ECF subfamily)
VVAGLIAALRDFDLAEEVLQEACTVALERWPIEGIPDRPGAWLTTVARRRALDRLRRAKIFAGKAAALAALEPPPDASDEDDVDGIFRDERLRLIFTCCHPALAQSARVALTLRTLGGLTTPEIARAFLVQESTMGQRLVRAKKKIREANIPYRVPPPEVIGERLEGVLAVVYLIFNEGYSATEGADLIRRDLCDEAIRLARVLASLLPQQSEVLGLLALLLLHDSRRGARLDAQGELVLLEDQDRSRWNYARAIEGLRILTAAAAMGRPGPYQLQARISAEHATAPTFETTDWTRVIGHYDQLLAISPSPVVALNRAVAIAMRDGPQAGLALVEPLASQLPGFYKLALTRADLLRRLGRTHESLAAYREALQAATNLPERRYLQRRIDELERTRN